MELTILHINDHHSNLDSKKKDFKLKNAAGATVTVNADAGGFARVTGAIKALRPPRPMCSSCTPVTPPPAPCTSTAPAIRAKPTRP